MFEGTSSFLRFAKICGFFITLISAPGAIQRLTNSGSQAPGFVLILLLSLILFKSKKITYLNTKVIIFLFVVSIYGAILTLFRSINYNIDIERLLISVPIFIFMTFQSKVIFNNLVSLSELNFRRFILIIYLFFVLNGIVGLTGVDIFMGELPKSVGVFGEPSFYGIVFAPFLISSLFLYNSNNARILIIMSIFGFGLLLQSLVLIIIGLMSLVVVVKIATSHLFLFIFAAGIVLALISVIDFDVNYYIDRLPFFGEANHTNYYYFQSIEELMISLRQSNYFGIGFQQLGVEEPKGYFANLIYSISGVIQTRYDGASLIYKIGTEFGILGLLFCVYLLWRSLKGFMELRNVLNDEMMPMFNIFLHSCLYTFVLFLFVRGSGYFNISFFLMLIFIFSTGNKKLI